MAKYSPLFELRTSITPQLATHLRSQLVSVDRDFDGWTLGRRCKAVVELVKTLVAIDLQYLARNPRTPWFYESGVRYRPQLTRNGSFIGQELWWDIPTILAHGEGSCEDLAAWRVAELIQLGTVARPYVHSNQTADLTVYHVVVHKGLVEEDPSKILGMPSTA